MYPRLGTTGLDGCIFARFKVNCEVMPLHNFANFKLVMNFKLILSRQRKELRWTPKSAGPLAMAYLAYA